MTTKSFRFDEIDEKMIEEVKELLKRTARTDIDAIRQALAYFLDNYGKEKNTSSTPKKEKAPVIPARFYEEAKDYFERDILCPEHPSKPMSRCGCSEDDLIKTLMTREGLLVV